MRLQTLFKRNISVTLYSGFALLIFILALSSLVGFFLIRQGDNDLTDLVDGTLPLHQAALDMRTNTDRTAEVVKDYVNNTATDGIAAAQDAEAEFENAAAEFEKLDQNNTYRQPGRQGAAMYEDFSRTGYEIMSLADIQLATRKILQESEKDIPEELDEMQMLLSQFRQDHLLLTAYLDEKILIPLEAQINQQGSSTQNSTAAAKNWLLIFGIIGTLIGTAAAWAASKRILTPLKKLLKGAEAVKKGQLQHRFDIDSKDEFGRLAFSLNQMLQNLGRSRAALGESEETAWALLDATTDSVILTDLRGIILASNEVAAQRLGKSLEQLIDVSLYDLLPAELMASRKAQIAEVIRSRKPLHLEDERDGMILDTRIFPGFSDKGNVHRIAIFSRDITTRKWVEEVTEQLSRRNELILEAAGEGIYGLDTEGKTTFVNPAGAKMLGYKPEDLIGQRHHELVHHSKPDGEPYPHQQCPVYAAFKDGAIHHSIGEEVFWRKDGTGFPVDYTSTPIFEHGAIVGAVVTFKDVTDRKRLEKALHQSEEKYRSIFENAANLILSVDREGFIIDCNSRARQILGYDPTEMIGHNLIEFIRSENRNQIQQCCNEVVNGGFRYGNPSKMIRKDGSITDVIINAAAAKDTAGEYVRTICMIESSSFLKQQEVEEEFHI